MKAKEWKKLLKNVDDEVEIKLYVWDYEYDNEEPYEVGAGKLIELDSGNCLNIGLHMQD